MGSLNEYSCWEIMQCDKSENCPARENPDKPCWEAVREKNDDYRNIFNICRDCIVQVLKTENPVLSDHEIKTILAAKTNCGFLCSRTVLSIPDKLITIQPPG